MNTMHRAIQGLSRLALCLGLLAAGGAHAQSSDLKIGFIDAEAVLLNAPQTQAAMRALQDEFAGRQRELVQKQQELQEKQATYERDQEVMGQEERTSLEREIRDGARALQRDDQEFQEDFNVRRNELLQEAQRAVSVRIEAFAVERGFDLILQNVVYSSDAINVTDEVVMALNAELLSSDSDD
ncbi:MAG: OmpH family outer membrane protein [Gammaproteobacteria bacterium]